MPTRFIWRLYAGYILLILLATVISVIFVSRQVQRDSLIEIEETLRSEAIMLAEIASPALTGTDGDGLQARVMALGLATRTRFTVIALDGRVLADSEEDPALMEPHGTRPEVLDARNHGMGKVTRYSRTLRVEMLYLALPATRNATPIGYVRAALPLDRIQHRLGETRRMILLGAAIAFAFALLLGLVLARRSTEPLRAMTEAAREMAAGAKRSRAPETRGSIEMRELAAAFNSMGDQLEERMEAIDGERNKLTAILSGMSEGVLAVDARERILHVNGPAAELLRINPDLDPGRPIWECSRIAEACALVSRAIQENRFLRREITLLGAGNQRIIELKVSPLPGEGNHPVGAVLVLNEVTELRQLEAIRRDFIANASHELKTPLTVILGLAETLHEDGSLDEKTRERFTEKLHRQVGRLSTLVGDLLSLSRLESASESYEKQPVDLTALVAECRAAQQTASEAKGVTLDADLPQVPLKVRGDFSALRQALDNLLDNAVKYTPAGGHIVISARSAGGEAIVEVSDSGMGIEPAAQARVFERFYRVDKARSRELGGTGLGLAIVKNVVLGHGGEVSVESVPGRGSNFRIRIPLLS